MGGDPDKNSGVVRDCTGSRKIEGGEQDPQDGGKREK